jgi:DNA polymerase epsilon subunit 1
MAGKYIFLYHTCSASAPLHVFTVFLPVGRVKLHLVDPATRRQPIGRLADIYAELHQRRLNTYGLSTAMNYTTSLEFSTTYHINDTTALKAVSRDLGPLETSHTLDRYRDSDARGTGRLRVSGTAWL